MDDEDKVVARIAAHLEREEDRQNEIDSLSYNGVVGLPPTWVPEFVIDRFREIRTRVLDDWRYTPEEMIVWLDRYDHLGELDSDWFYPGEYPNGRQLDPDLFMDAVGFLAHLKWVASLDAKEGLRKLAGDAAVTGHGVLSGASKGGKARVEECRKEREELQAKADLVRSSFNSREPSKREIAKTIVLKETPKLTGIELEKAIDRIRKRIS